jgi:hypothetical protein
MLLEYCILTNSSSDEFQRVHENIRTAIERLSPDTEYKEFVLENRCVIMHNAT